MASPADSRSWPVARDTLLLWVLVIVGIAIAVGPLIQVMTRHTAQFRPAGAVGSLQTVTLSSGQVFFGRLKSVDRSEVVLTDVYDAVTTTDAKTDQRTTRLVSRRVADWHGPLDMAIPTERILFTESIGPDSIVGKAMTSGIQPK